MNYFSKKQIDEIIPEILHRSFALANGEPDLPKAASFCGVHPRTLEKALRGEKLQRAKYDAIVDAFFAKETRKPFESIQSAKGTDSEKNDVVAAIDLLKEIVAAQWNILKDKVRVIIKVCN